MLTKVRSDKKSKSLFYVDVVTINIKGGSRELASTSRTPQAVPNNVPKRKRPTVRLEIMAKHTAMVKQASKLNLKRKAEEVEHDQSKRCTVSRL